MAFQSTDVTVSTLQLKAQITALDRYLKNDNQKTQRAIIFTRVVVRTRLNIRLL